MEHKTERLILRAYTKNDRENIYKLFTEKFVKTYEMHLQMKSISAVDNYLEWHIKNEASPNRTHYFYVIELQETREFLGIVGYSFVEKAVMELEYYLLEEHWGKGYMTEALRKAIAVAFENRHAVKLFAQCHVDNPNSENVMKKCGMVKAAIQPKPKSYFGIVKENVRYEITVDTYMLEM